MGLRPAGTGLSLDRIILVSVPTPWPKPALAHPWLKAASRAVVASAVPTRLFAAEPWLPDDEIGIELYERDGVGFRGYRWVIEQADMLEDPGAVVAELVQRIASAPHGTHGMAPIDVTVPTFLVCTQGSHDECCGRFGEDLAGRIEVERPGYRLRRVSHTGGHRFAPTFLALPSGRMWAYADLALVDRVANASVTIDDLLMLCRGWLGASTGPGQVAELAARIEAGNPFLTEPMISVAPASSPEGDDVTSCEVTVDGTTIHVGVHKGREVPTIACESPGGLPVKVTNEYAWTVHVPATEEA